MTIKSAVSLAILSLVVATSVLPYGALAASGDLYLDAGNVTMSDSTVVNNQTVRIYATVGSNSQQDLLGSVQFKNITTGHVIGKDQPISVLAGKTDTVFVDWKPTAGNYSISVTVYPWDTSADDSGNNGVTFATLVDYDNDGDLTGNTKDTDDDNDGVKDSEDTFPYDQKESADTDKDGIGDNADTDDDNDSIEDTTDALPKDSMESVDTDGDGTGDNTDEDDDNDGLSDEKETSTTYETGVTAGGTDKTDPKNPDTDGDTIVDGADAFPLDPEESADIDEDGLGNNMDKDDDGDGLKDPEDEYPENHGPVIEVKQYEETDGTNGQKYLILDASASTDPDGNAGMLRFQWLDKDGRILGEKEILKLAFPFKNILPSTLMVFDDTGESRTYNINLNNGAYLKALGVGLLLSLLVALALKKYIKYTATASKKKGPKKANKLS
ncbi:MAG: hypothetical protein ACD_28C00140G0003 [uncultured bacterium]|nr:MAG: hypothetical protein ACD_28C00140G0003 [uncultured bacterium]KKT73333.1 MAG: ATPase [Candidatus Peregrinibacteria bacterium GW2011_GWA2_44_7]